MNIETLTMGLDALARAHAGDWFGDGHRGAAVLSAAFLCSEQPVEPEAAAIMSGMIRQHWHGRPVFRPFPSEVPDAGLIERVAAALDAGAAHYRQVGHNVIFGALALKALHRVPEACTPSRVEGIVRLLDSFGPPEKFVEPADAPEMPAAEPAAVADFVLREFPRCTSAFDGHGQGWSGHLLTFGGAIIDLIEQGYGEIARHAMPAFAQYIARIRMGPQDRDIPRPEHPRRPVNVLTATYWQERSRHAPALGHCFKYPYGLYGLLDRAPDAEVRRTARNEAWRVL